MTVAYFDQLLKSDQSLLCPCFLHVLKDFDAKMKKNEAKKGIFFPVPHSSEIFSLCQDRLSGNASKLGTALLCSSRVGSLYDTPNVVAIYYYVWKQQYIFHLEAYLIGSSGVWTHDLSIMMRTCCHISYHASVKIGIIDAHYQTQVEQ